MTTRLSRKTIAGAEERIISSPLLAAPPANEHARCVPITEVGPRDCRYIVDDGIVPALCCGEFTRFGTSWCERHCEIVYTSAGLRVMRDRARPRRTTQ
jgi:hypothetical protein